MKFEQFLCSVAYICTQVPTTAGTSPAEGVERRCRHGKYLLQVSLQLSSFYDVKRNESDKSEEDLHKTLEKDIQDNSKRCMQNQSEDNAKKCAQNQSEEESCLDGCVVENLKRDAWGNEQAKVVLRKKKEVHKQIISVTSEIERQRLWDIYRDKNMNAMKVIKARIVLCPGFILHSYFKVESVMDMQNFSVTIM
uniref:Uncharacterized protein n=1 Tax=Timema poppense TaxID=170557 RepID=A0A7R9CP74_TIMPO|nr:unnamed protein product [Timema poppensis]